MGNSDGEVLFLVLALQCNRRKKKLSVVHEINKKEEYLENAIISVVSCNYMKIGLSSISIHPEKFSKNCITYYHLTLESAQ